MPLYEYECPKCGAEVEMLVRNLSEKPSCPKCGHNELNRLLSCAAAPSISGKNLPVCPPPSVGCGRPQCGSGGCMFGD
ncbi:MAG TPA: hypothetical protein DCF63_17470 [Planctomycetaceae bacterium]|nr:hypothetical protein [Planctomycetaceae bacterium]